MCFKHNLFRSSRIAFVAFLATSLATIADSAHAQITYDATNRAYFITSDTNFAIDTDFDPATNDYYTDGYTADVFVGVSNAADFTLLANPITVNIVNGAVTSYRGGYYPVGSPQAGFYQGLNSFGNSRVNFVGGYVGEAHALNTSVFDVSGGTVINVFAHHQSTVNLSALPVEATRPFSLSKIAPPFLIRPCFLPVLTVPVGFRPTSAPALWGLMTAAPSPSGQAPTRLPRPTKAQFSISPAEPCSGRPATTPARSTSPAEPSLTR